MSKGRMYVDRTNRHSRHKLPMWLYNIRYWLARWITPPYLITYIVLPFDENSGNVCISDGETCRPLFEAKIVYLRRPAWSRWNDQTCDKYPRSQSGSSAET